MFRSFSIIVLECHHAITQQAQTGGSVLACRTGILMPLRTQHIGTSTGSDRQYDAVVECLALTGPLTDSPCHIFRLVDFLIVSTGKIEIDVLRRRSHGRQQQDSR